MRGAWWWIDRWRKSSAFICMTLEQQGLYRNLLDVIWLFDGKAIPDEEKALISASGGDARAWAEHGATVLKWMRRVEGGWTNDTATEIMTEARRLSKIRAEAGAKGARSRWQTDGKVDSKRYSKPNGKPDSKHHSNGGAPSPSPSPSPYPSLDLDNSTDLGGEGISPTRTSAHPATNGGGDGFERFWTAYPNKKGKDAARKAWAKRHPTPDLIARILTAVEQQTHWADWTKDGGRFVPHPATWLNRGSWDDEPVAPSLVSDLSRTNLAAIEGAKALLKARRG